MQRSVHFDFSPSQPKVPLPSPQRTEYSFKRNVTYHEHSSDFSLEKKKTGMDFVKGTNIMKVSRKQIKGIHDWVESSLQKELSDIKLGKKQLSQTNSDIELFKKQIEVLSSAMEKLVIVTKEQCIEQADLMDRLWKSAFELHDRVHKFTNTAINELRCEQMDNVLSIRKLKHQVQLFKLQPEIRTSSIKSQQLRYDEQPSSEESRAEVAALTAELLLKDQELLGLHHTIAQLSVWFPQFPVYSQSLLSKLLPPVKRSDQLSSEYSQVTPDKILLQDLRRLEEIGLGFKVVHPEDTAGEQAMGHANLDTNLEDDSMTKASIDSSNNFIILEPNLPRLPAYESQESPAELKQRNDNLLAISYNPSIVDQLQPSIVTIDNISRSHSLGDLSFSQSVVNGNESFKLLLTISLEQEQKIIALKNELGELKSRHDAELSTLQAEIGHLNAALSIQRGKPAPENSHISPSSGSHDTQKHISSQNYVNMLSFVRRNSSVGSVVSMQAVQNDHGTAIPVSNTASNVMTISQINGHLIDFMRFTTTHPDRGFNEIFGAGSLDSRTSVAGLIPILPDINALHFENKTLRSIKTWNPYVVIRLLKYFSFELEDCKGGQVMTERLLLSLLHIIRDSPTFSVHYQHFLSEMFGIPIKAGRDPTVNAYSLKSEWQRDFRNYLYVSVFEESFKAMQAFISNKMEAGQSSFPLPMTSRILHRIFDVRNSSFDSSSSFESCKALSSQGNKWWLCLTSRLLDDLKLKVEMAAFQGNLDLTTDHHSDNKIDVPMVNCYSCLYFCWQYVQLLHSLWSNILAGVYTYLVSVIPSNASSQQFHLLLGSILEHPYLFSSLSTSPNRKNGEDGNGRSDLTLLSPSQPSLSKSLHESDSPTVNATLVDELMSLAAADNLNKESFADAILRANCSTLVRSLGHLIDPYYFTNAEESPSLWNSHDEDIHMEGRLLMAELQSLCEEHFPVGLQSTLPGVGSTESEFMNRNSYEYKIHKMNMSCRRQLHLPSGISTHTASPSVLPSSGSRADLSMQFSEPSLASGTSYAASSIQSHSPKHSSQHDAKAIKLRRSYFKESLLASKVLYPKEVDVPMPMMTAAAPPSDEQDDDYNYKFTEAHSEPEADSLQVEYLSQVLSFAERILLQARQCFNPHFVKVKKPSKLDVTLTLMTMRYYIGVSRKVKAKMIARNGSTAEQSGVIVSRRSSAYTTTVDLNNSSNQNSISLLSSLIVGNHGDWYKYQKAVFFGRRKSMNNHFRAWAKYSVSQFSQDG